MFPNSKNDLKLFVQGDLTVLRTRYTFRTNKTTVLKTISQFSNDVTVTSLSDDASSKFLWTQYYVTCQEPTHPLLLDQGTIHHSDMYKLPDFSVNEGGGVAEGKNCPTPRRRILGKGAAMKTMQLG
jgi:hypothetical protein